MKIHKFKFWVNNIESEIYEYDEDDYNNYEELLEHMEEDRIVWIFENIDTGYEKIKN